MLQGYGVGVSYRNKQGNYIEINGKRCSTYEYKNLHCILPVLKEEEQAPSHSFPADADTIVRPTSVQLGPQGMLYDVLATSTKETETLKRMRKIL